MQRARMRTAWAALGHWWRRWRKRLLRVEPWLLLILLASAAGVWAFVELAGEVLEGETEAFDQWAIQATRDPDHPEYPIGSKVLHEVGRDLTALGSVAVLSLVVTAAFVTFLLLGRRREAWYLVAATISGTVVGYLLKEFFARPRPDLGSALTAPLTASFPSGHSLMSAVVYLTLGALAAALAPRRRVKFFLLGIAALVAITVGLSRIYLGVHYPTDVLAGWTFGLAWAFLCWGLMRAIQNRMHGKSFFLRPYQEEPLVSKKSA